MFEDMSTESIVFSIFMIIILFISMVLAEEKAKKEGRKSNAKIVVAILIIGLLGMEYYSNISIKKSNLVVYDNFKKGRDIFCYGVGKTYIVSKNRDWKRYKDGFSKNDILLDIKTCRVEE